MIRVCLLSSECNYATEMSTKDDDDEVCRGDYVDDDSYSDDVALSMTMVVIAMFTDNIDVDKDQDVTILFS